REQTIRVDLRRSEVHLLHIVKADSGPRDIGSSHVWTHVVTHRPPRRTLASKSDLSKRVSRGPAPPLRHLRQPLRFQWDRFQVLRLPPVVAGRLALCPHLEKSLLLPSSTSLGCDALQEFRRGLVV